MLTDRSPTAAAVVCHLALACAACVQGAPPPTSAPAPREIVLPGQGSYGAGLTFTSDGTSLLYYDGRGIATWDLTRGEVVAHLPTREWVFVVSPDGTRIANGTDRSIRLHDAKTGQLLHTLKPPPTDAPPAPGADLPYFRANGFGERSRQFFTTSPEGIQVWDVASGKMVGHIVREQPPHNNGSVQSHDGRWLTVDYPTTDGVEVLDTRTGEAVNITSKGVFQLAPRDGKRFVMVSLGSWSFARNGGAIYGTDQMNGLLLAWSLPDGRLRSHARIPGLVFAKVSGDASRVVAHYREPDDRIVRVLDGRTQRVVATLGPLEDTAAWYAISPDGRYVAASSLGDTRLWDLTPGAPARKRPATRPAVRGRPID